MASILIAFSLDAWWNQRTENEAYRSLLTALRADFEANEDLLTRWVALHERTLVSTSSMLALLREVPDGTMIGVSDTLLASAMMSPTYEPITGEVDLAVSSGSLSLIESELLKRLIVEWPRTVQDAREDELTSKAVMHDWILPLLRADSDIESMFVAAGDRANTDGRSSSYSAKSIASTSAIRAGPQLRALFAQRQWHIQLLLAGLAEVKVVQDSVLSVVDSELARYR